MRSDNRGYGDLSSEQLDPSSPQLDCKETFNVCPDSPGAGPDDFRAFDPRNPRASLSGKQPVSAAELEFRWPPDALLPGFRATMMTYLKVAMAVAERLNRLFATDLLGPEHADHFAPYFADPQVTLRLLRYPVVGEVTAARRTAAAGLTAAAAGGGGGNAEIVVGGVHTDYDQLTLLVTNGVPGLQVQHRATGRWIDVPHIPGAIIVNVADCLQRWTNDIYKSTPHRILAPPAERFSIALFVGPSADTVVAALPGTGPPRYAPITAGEHLKQKLDETYAFRRNSQQQQQQQQAKL